VWPQNLHHDGAALARSYDVVVVTHNHRLGLLGFLDLGDLLGEEYAASGAAGMLDIAAALRWVVDKAEVFGGDPLTVMIRGESGGGSEDGHPHHDAAGQGAVPAREHGKRGDAAAHSKRLRDGDHAPRPRRPPVCVSRRASW
jgi:Carboxylesterase family